MNIKARQRNCSVPRCCRVRPLAISHSRLSATFGLTITLAVDAKSIRKYLSLLREALRNFKTPNCRCWQRLRNVSALYHFQIDLCMSSSAQECLLHVGISHMRRNVPSLPFRRVTFAFSCITCLIRPTRRQIFQPGADLSHSYKYISSD